MNDSHIRTGELHAPIAAKGISEREKKPPSYGRIAFAHRGQGDRRMGKRSPRTGELHSPIAGKIGEWGGKMGACQTMGECQTMGACQTMGECDSPVRN